MHDSPIKFDKEPWGRQEAESAPAHEAFLVYRDMPAGERSVVKVGQKLGKSRSLMERWCSYWQWVRRVHAWDAYLMEARDEAAIDEARRWKENIKLSTDAHLKEIDRQLQRSDLKPLEIKHLMEAFAAAVKCGGFARGLDSRGCLPGSGAMPQRLTKTIAGIDESEVLGTGDEDDDEIGEFSPPALAPVA
jgi:hypothetical protein